MRAALKRYFVPIIDDIRSQLECPTKSLLGVFLSRSSSRNTRHMKKKIIDSIDIQPDSNILEIYYGRGDGIGFVLERMKEGRGAVYGIERSKYLEDTVLNRFTLERHEKKSINLSRSFDLRYLPYPSNFFDGVFHIDSYYYWQSRSHQILHEICRVLKPGAPLITAMQLSRLRWLEKYNLIHEKQYNPASYLFLLEPSGFENVKMEYVEQSSNNSNAFEMISARKCDNISDRQSMVNPEICLENLEKRIKQDMVLRRIIEEGRVIHDSRAVTDEVDAEELSMRKKD